MEKPLSIVHRALTDFSRGSLKNKNAERHMEIGDLAWEVSENADRIKNYGGSYSPIILTENMTSVYVCPENLRKVECKAN